MSEKEPTERERDLDRFWDIGSLIPGKKKMTFASENTDAVDVVSEAPTFSDAADKKPETHFIPPHTPEESAKQAPDFCYEPDSPLLARVEVFSRKSNYRYYEEFVRSAAKLYPLRGEECERAPFFSYVPQYSQMTREQLEWYLWWRDCFRHGRFLETDFSYLILYAYEIINLAGRMDPETGRDELAKLWANYRQLYRQLDGCLPEWICDYCLLQRLPPPEVCMGTLLSEVIAHCNLREFFVVSKGEAGYVRALLTFCSNYDYRKSKFYSGDAVPVFDRAIPAAVEGVLRRTSPDGKLFSAVRMDRSEQFREAFSGALCSYRVKKKIEVEYDSFSRSHEMRFLVTDIVKYTENRVRAAFGIRSRLTVYSLPDDVRKMLDEDLISLLPAKSQAPKKTEEPPVYERLYDLPKKEFSLSDAAKIEEISWLTTEKLVEAFGDGDGEVPTEKAADPIAIPSERESGTAPESAKNTSSEIASFADFVAAIDGGNRQKIAESAEKMGLLTDAAVDRVNELFTEQFGDILIEDNGGGYAVIEDYRGDFERLLQDCRKG